MFAVVVVVGATVVVVVAVVVGGVAVVVAAVVGGGAVVVVAAAVVVVIDARWEKGIFVEIPASPQGSCPSGWVSSSMSPKSFVVTWQSKYKPASSRNFMTS